MVNSSDDPVVALARRLRGLRQAGFTGKSITQRHLADALSQRERTSVPLISSWENLAKPTIPPESRIDAYATFFATSRSHDGHLIDIGEMTEREKVRYEELLRELTHLRNEAVSYLESPASPVASLENGLWHFPPDHDVTIICAVLPEILRQRMKPYTDPGSPDYVKLYRFADPDALLDLYGHIRAANPLNHVNIRTPSERLGDAYTAHLVVLGGVDWNPVTRDLLRRIELPVRQVGRDENNPSGGFEVGDKGENQLLQPEVRKFDDEEVLLEDVAHFYRGPNPFNKQRTVTICSGMYGRGTLGAVRALTDPRFRDRNEEYVRDTFAGSDRFSIVTRVYIVSGEVVTPDWTLPDIRLHEWPKESIDANDQAGRSR